MTSTWTCSRASPPSVPDHEDTREGRQEEFEPPSDARMRSHCAGICIKNDEDRDKVNMMKI